MPVRDLDIRVRQRLIERTDLTCREQIGLVPTTPTPVGAPSATKDAGLDDMGTCRMDGWPILIEDPKAYDFDGGFIPEYMHDDVMRFMDRRFG